MERKREENRKERGQSLIEMALLIPILLIILAGVLDLGRLYFAYVAVTDAAADGAAYASIVPSDTPGIISRAQSATGGLIASTAVNVTVTPPETVAFGAPITVTTQYDFHLATPLLNIIVPGGVLPLRAEVTEVIRNPSLEE